MNFESFIQPSINIIVVILITVILFFNKNNMDIKKIVLIVLPLILLYISIIPSIFKNFSSSDEQQNCNNVSTDKVNKTQADNQETRRVISY